MTVRSNTAGNRRTTTDHGEIAEPEDTCFGLN
jgi:hypothetical protein